MIINRAPRASDSWKTIHNNNKSAALRVALVSWGLKSLFNKLFCSCFSDKFCSFPLVRNTGDSFVLTPCFLLLPPPPSSTQTVIITKTEQNHIKVNESNNGNPWIKCHKTNEFSCLCDWNWFLFLFSPFRLLPVWILMNDFCINVRFMIIMMFLFFSGQLFDGNFVNCN